MEIHVLKRIDGVLSETNFPSGSTIKVGIGTRELNPISGTFTLGYSGEETSDIPYNATNTQIQTALNALASVASEDGVTVNTVGDGFMVRWNSGLTHGAITANADGLFPKSFVRLTPLDSATEQSVFLHLTQSVIAFSDTWTQLPTAVSVVDTIVPFADGSKVERISISNDPSGGYINLGIYRQSGGTMPIVGTVSMDVTISAADLRTLIRSKLANPDEVVGVTKTDEFTWDITFSANIFPTVMSESIISAKGVYGSLSLNTPEVHTFLAGQETKDSILEVNVLTTEGEQTVLQVPVSIWADVIDSATLVPLVLEAPLGEATANARFVRRDATQNPTGSELNNIWLNLGVTKFGTDVAGAISSSDTPSAANPFVTSSQLIGLATESFVTTQGYIDSSALAGLATETFVGTAVSGSKITNYDNFRMYVGGDLVLEGNRIYRFNSSVGAAGYGPITHPSYWTEQSASPSLTGYATESWVTTQAYLTSGNLIGYATEGFVDAGYESRSSWKMNAIAASSFRDINQPATSGQFSFTYYDGFSAQDVTTTLEVQSPVDGADYNGYSVAFDSTMSSGSWNVAGTSVNIGLSGYANMQDALNTLSHGGSSGGWKLIGSGSPYANADVLMGAGRSVHSGILTAENRSLVVKEGIYVTLSDKIRELGYYDRIICTDANGSLTNVPRNFYIESQYASGFASKYGTTFTGKVNFATLGVATPCINIGGQCDTAPALASNGDIWISNATSPKLSYKSGGANLYCATSNLTNTFSSSQIIDTTTTNAALRVTQKGTGNAIEVEDSTTPDSTRFVVDQHGKVGIGTAPDATAAIKIDGNGMSFNGLVFNPTQTASHTGGTNTADLLVTIGGVNYRISLRPA
jgi:hypothetical protein